ncbi:uncharacterized protein PHACADRAFT_257036 [Phanerochaete carnosa HHB-10118-sp]|uniref:DUF6699 domain-containing protein n=1 Tax=Phanerochaete carnosa (strain HHB-10118-sp) TaxID=650164 RepID=K5W9Y5_PHACS|nr:uncharacterized protein PHACADRAFT_257036 [Phanerochaete carnosa HHB-10118-sp]EKM56020.1 hypothetical protein PHACADRAFT_257036 [Phanerochaete carnosa HHB-10118-sp]
MGLLDRLRGKLDIVSTPTAPKIGRIPLPEVDSPAPVKLTLNVAASYVDDGSSSSSSGHTPSPGTPVKRRRIPSLLSRSSTPTVVASSPPPKPPKTPSCTAPQAPELVAPTPRWKTAPSLMEQGWKNVASPEPAPKPARPARTRAASMDVVVPPPHRPSPSEQRTAAAKDKPRAMTPQVGQHQQRPRPPSTSHRPERTDSPMKTGHAPSSKPRRASASQARADTPPCVVPPREPAGEPQTPRVRSASRATDRAGATATAKRAPPPPKKGILKPTGPTPVDTSLLAPSELPSQPPTPVPLPTAAPFGLHWQLLPPRAAPGRYVRFDAGLPVYLIKRHTGGGAAAGTEMLERDFCKAAVEGVRLTRMTLRCAQLRHWPDIVVWNPKGVTCGDVFDAVYDMLHTPLTERECARLLEGEETRRRVVEAFAQRCRDAPLLDEYVRQQGLRRIDVLEGKRVFAGMQLVSGDRCDLWQMSFESPA